MIPHTQRETALSQKTVGSIVNIECDVVGKYVEKFLLEKKEEKPKSRVSESFLTEHGFL